MLTKPFGRRTAVLDGYAVTTPREPKYISRTSAKSHGRPDLSLGFMYFPPDFLPAVAFVRAPGCGNRTGTADTSINYIYGTVG